MGQSSNKARGQSLPVLVPVLVPVTGPSNSQAQNVASKWEDKHFSDHVVLSRVLIGVTDRSSAEDVSTLLSYTGVNLLISRVLHPDRADAAERAQSIQLLYLSHSQNNLAWSLGGQAEGHLASLVGPALVKLHQLLLLTLPGTPVINYGDEICLMDEVRTLHCRKQINLKLR